MRALKSRTAGGGARVEAEAEVKVEVEVEVEVLLGYRDCSVDAGADSALIEAEPVPPLVA
jgi:hypothetical protein